MNMNIEIFIFSSILFIFLLINSNFAFAQLPICNESKIQKSAIQEATVDKDGFTKVKFTYSYSNPGNDCLLVVSEAFGINGGIPIENPIFSDSNGKIFEPIINNVFYDVFNNLTLSSGGVYSVYFNYELVKSIKYPDGNFYLSPTLQISDIHADNIKYMAQIESREPWFKIKINETSPTPDNFQNDNVFVWNLKNPEKDSRTIEKIVLEYRYDFEWNTIILLVAGAVLGVIIDRLLLFPNKLNLSSKKKKSRKLKVRKRK
jgi:hypothetical protein